MTILILSRRSSLYSTRRLIRAGKKRGHKVIVIDPLQCTLALDRGKPLLYFRRKRLKGIDVVIPRIGSALADYGLSVLAHLEMGGIPVLNPSSAIAKAKDKFQALQFLSAHAIDTPRTALVRNPEDIDRALKIVGGLPVILKVPQGTHGVGVILAESRQSVESTLEAFWSIGQDILIQEFVKESYGRDIRALVLDGKIVAAMRRHARVGEFRSNIHKGAIGIPLELKKSYRNAAIQAAQVMGLRFAGIDMLEGKGGPRVVEVNASPGIEGMERVAGKNIAGLIISYAVGLARKKNNKDLGRRGYLPQSVDAADKPDPAQVVNARAIRTA